MESFIPNVITSCEENVRNVKKFVMLNYEKIKKLYAESSMKKFQLSNANSILGFVPVEARQYDRQTENETREYLIKTYNK